MKPTSTFKAKFAQIICRLLPPFLSYRVHFRFFGDLVGSGIPFRGKALFGKAEISSVMNDYVDVHFALHGTLNFKGMVVASSVIKPGDVVFELGANIATETLALSNLLGSEGRVIAVEADPLLCEKICSRLSMANISNVEVVNKAVAESEGIINVMRDQEFNSGRTFTSKIPNGDCIIVETITADKLVDEFGMPSFVFMDIEGAEYGFLLGARHLLSKARPIIFTEVSSAYLYRSGGTIHDFCKILDEFAYIAYDTDTRLLEEVHYKDVSEDTYTDWLLIPREKAELLPIIRYQLFRARIMPRIWSLNPLDALPSKK